MSHIDQERTCATCEQTFRLSEHGVAGAKAVAHALDTGAMSEDDAPAVATTCPACLGTEQLDTSAANAEMFRLEHAATQSRNRQVSRNVKTYASGLALLGTVSGLGFQFVAAFRGHSVLTWSATAFSVSVALAGVLIGVVVVMRVHGGGRSRF